MSWKQHIFKPRWQHKDPGIRREAVTSMQDPELMAALPSICLEDEDAGVRAAAARRITDLESLFQAQSRESDPDVDKVISQRLQQLAASAAKDRPAIEARLKIVSATSDREMLELVAIQAPESQLRKAALARVKRQGLLGDRAANDPDPGLRRYAAALITQLSTLRRVIDATRKTDKSLHLELSERLHTELLATGDPRAVRTEALAVCEQVEEYALRHQQGPAAVPAEISERWNALGPQVPDDLQNRFAATVTRLEHPAVADPEPEVVTAPTVETSEAEVTPAQEPEQPDDVSPADHSLALEELLSKLDQLRETSGGSLPAKQLQKLQGEWKQAWSAIAAPADSDKVLEQKAGQIFAQFEAVLEQAKQQKEQLFSRANSLLEQLEQQLEDGALHKALETRHELQKLGKSLKQDRDWKAVNRKMASWHGRIRELRDWQHWSNDKIRKKLIGEMEILPQADLHPDALLDRVKSLQKEWKELEASEQIPGDDHYHAAPWMWRKFSAAGNQAFAAAKPFLEKRDEIRDRHLQELQSLCDDLADAASAAAPDWTALTKLLQVTRKELRNLDKVPQKARKKIASRLRSALEKGNAAVQDHYGEVEKHKLKLIRAASQLAHATDTGEAIREAKRLQSEWKSAGSLWRSKENELWKAFREPLDPLFGKLKADQESEREEIRGRLEAQENLCRDLEEVLSGSDESLADSQGKVQGLKDGWRDIEHPNRRLQGRFQELANTFEKRVASFHQQQADRVRQNWWDKSKILHELENTALESASGKKMLKEAQSNWPPGNSDEVIDQLLNKRFQALVDGQKPEAASKETAEIATGLCIQLEFLAGLPSPAKEKDRRMKYQVDRLSRTMSGDSERLSAAEEARNVEREWLTLGVLGATDHARFERRIKKALIDIYGRNSV